MIYVSLYKHVHMRIYKYFEHNIKVQKLHIIFKQMCKYYEFHERTLVLTCMTILW